MADLPPIPDETLEVLRNIPTQTLIDGLWVKGWPMTFIEGAGPLQLGQKMAGRAVTLRFVPHRPDLAADKPKGEQSAEYVAIELCGPGEVLVTDETYRTASPNIGSSEERTMELKGKEAPILAHLLITEGQPDPAGDPSSSA